MQAFKYYKNYLILPSSRHKIAHTAGKSDALMNKLDMFVKIPTERRLMATVGALIGNSSMLRLNKEHFLNYVYYFFSELS